MPQPSVWGPALWVFLHTFAARVGKGSTITRVDETREALWLIDHLEAVIPCADCRKHWRHVRLGAPGLPTDEWVFKAHNVVNRRLGKLEMSEMPIVTGSPREAWGKYIELVKDSLAQGHLIGAHVSEFTHHVGLWNSFA